MRVAVEPRLSGIGVLSVTYAREMASTPLPTPSLIVLIGPPASGKSTWAAENFTARQVVSTDTLRGVVGEHELDLDATDDAFELLDRIVELRLGRRLTTVIDTTGLDPIRRAGYQAVAKRHDVTAVAVRFTTSAAECRRRNRERIRPVPVKALDKMIKAARSIDPAEEGWDLVLTPEPVRMVTPKLSATVISAPAEAHDEVRGGDLRFGLLVSSYDWPGGNESIGPTLARIAHQAEGSGFESLWVMDHMIQIPQVGSAWDPMLDSYTTLGFLAHATERIRLGVLVSAVTFRNIGHLAKMVATLDVLSGGRAIAGLGAGSFEREHHAYGWSFPPARRPTGVARGCAPGASEAVGPGQPELRGAGRVDPRGDGLSAPRPRPGSDGRRRFGRAGDVAPGRPVRVRMQLVRRRRNRGREDRRAPATLRRARARPRRGRGDTSRFDRAWARPPRSAGPGRAAPARPPRPRSLRRCRERRHDRRSRSGFPGPRRAPGCRR